MRKKRKLRNEIILITVVIVIAVTVVVVQNMNKSKGDKVILNIDGEKIGEHMLYKDMYIAVDIDNKKDITISDNELDKKEIEQYMLECDNIIRIYKGKVSVIEANCRDKICVKHKQIEYKGENIICLPHNLIVTVDSDEENDVDEIVR